MIPNVAIRQRLRRQNHILHAVNLNFDRARLIQDSRIPDTFELDRCRGLKFLAHLKQPFRRERFLDGVAGQPGHHGREVEIL